MLKINMLISHDCFCSNFSYDVASMAKERLFKEYFCIRGRKEMLEENKVIQ